MILPGVVQGSDLTDADFRLLAESIPHIVWMSSADGAAEYFNQQGLDYVGCTAAARRASC